jgi:hypothetical protein
MFGLQGSRLPVGRQQITESRLLKARGTDLGSEKSTKSGVKLFDLKFGHTTTGRRSIIRRGGLTFMPNKRGNSNWGRPMLPASVLCTEFEMQAKHLHLTPDQYVGSAPLRKWCEKNKNQYYVPEWLLKAWNMSVNSDLTGAA